VTVGDEDRATVIGGQVPRLARKVLWRKAYRAAHNTLWLVPRFRPVGRLVAGRDGHALARRSLHGQGGRRRTPGCRSTPPRSVVNYGN